MSNRLTAEFVGTLWLVFAGCGTAVLAGTHGVGILGVALAFGLAVVVMGYTIGHISGCHVNPAVTVGMWSAGRFAGRDVLPYVAAQVLGGIGGAAIVYFVGTGKMGFDVMGGVNGFADHSPMGVSVSVAFVLEAILAFVLVAVVLGCTDARAPHGFAPLVIGLCLTLIYLVSMPVTGGAVNPARSMAPALFVGGWAVNQLWLFWLAPLVGAVIAGWSYKCCNK